MTQVSVQRKQEQELRRALRDIRQGIDAYKKAHDEGRIAKTLNSSGYPRTLEVLVDGVPDLRSPKRSKIFFMRRIPRDPFNKIKLSLTTKKTGWRGFERFQVFSKKRAPVKTGALCCFMLNKLLGYKSSIKLFLSGVSLKNF